MKRKKILIILLIINSLYGNNKEEGINYLNKIREEVGLNIFKENKQLWKSSKNHSNYIKINKIPITHIQELNNFNSGKTPWERAEYVGYNNKFVSENISGGIEDYKTSIDLLMTAIYHRIGFLNLNINEIGFYKNEDVITYNMGNSIIREICNKKGGNIEIGICNNKNVIYKEDIEKIKLIEKRNPKYIIYPSDEQENVLPAFYDETPNPIPDKIVTGNPISIQFNPSKVKNVNIKSFKLYEGYKEIENTRILNSITDPNKKLNELEFVLFPLERLKWGKRYSVEIKGTIDNKFFEKKWDFYTKRLDGEIYIIKNSINLEMWKNKNYYLYIDPNNFARINQLISSCKNIEFIDYNTLKINIENSCEINIKNKIIRIKQK